MRGAATGILQDGGNAYFYCFIFLAMRMISSILDLVGECFSEMLVQAVLFGFAGLLAGVLLLYLIRKGKANPVRLRWLLPTYRVLIPLALGAMLGGGAALMKAKSFTYKQVNKTVLPLIKATFPSYQLYLKFNKIELYSKRVTVQQTIDEHLSFIEYHPLKKGSYEKIKVKAANRIVPRLAKWGLFEALHAGVPAVVPEEKISGYYDGALAFDIDKLPREEWVQIEKTLEEKVDAFFMPYFIKHIGVSGIFFLLPLCHLLIHMRKRD